MTVAAHEPAGAALRDGQRRGTRHSGDFSTAEEFFSYRRDAFDRLYRMGTEGRPRILTIGLHGRIIGRPGRIGPLQRLLDYIQRHEAIWLGSHAAIARHWIAHHSPS